MWPPSYRAKTNIVQELLPLLEVAFLGDEPEPEEEEEDAVHHVPKHNTEQERERDNRKYRWKFVN